MQRVPKLLALSECAHPNDAPVEVRPTLQAIVRTLRTVLPVGLWPKPYQLVAAAYCELAGDRCLIADEQGLGKTVEAILRIILRGHAPVVIITTTSMLSTWERELKTWIPLMPVHLVSSQASSIPPTGWRGAVVTTWGLLDSHAVGLRTMAPKLVIADEGHYASNPDARRTQALGVLLDAAPHALVLTGTPLKNGAKELWCILNLLDAKAFPDPEPFEDLEPEDIDIAETPMQRKIRQYMIRRLKEAVLPDLPKKTHHNILVPLSPQLRAEYDAADRRFRLWLESTLRVRMLADAQRRGLSLSNSDIAEQVYHRVRRAMNAEYLAKITHLRRIAGLAKVPVATEWIMRHARAHDPVIVFAEHTQVIQALVAACKQAGVEVGVIVGSTSKHARKATIEAFNSGKLNTVIASQAAKEGLTLVRAAHMLRVERWWNPAAEDQGDDRIHRIGQTREVYITVLHAAHTVDTRMAEINRTKRSIVTRIIGATPLDARNPHP